jgi:hypothetical protein
MLAGQSYNSSLADTVLSVYVAKRRSEIAPGVGEVTEMVSVAPGNPLSSLNEGVMDKLDVEYRKIVAAENDAFTAGRREMSAYVEELARQASKQGTGGVPQESPSPEGS